MTLDSATNKVQYSGDGATVSFAVTFVYWDDTDILVTHRDSSGTETVWTDGTQYTLAGGSGATGTLTVDTSPTDYTPASGETLTIESARANLQPTSLPGGGELPSGSIEQALDQLARLVQQENQKNARQLSYPTTDSTSLSAEIPDSTTRASSMLGFDASGEPVVVTNAADSAVAAAASATAAAASATAAANSAKTVFMIALGNEATVITTGLAKVTFRMPFAMTLTSVKASLTTASSSGIPTFDINEGGATVLSTKLTIDASETTSATAAAAAVISDSALAADAEMTIDVDVAGTGAAGAKIYLIGDPV